MTFLEKINWKFTRKYFRLDNLAIQVISYVFQYITASQEHMVHKLCAIKWQCILIVIFFSCLDTTRSPLTQKWRLTLL